MMPARPAGPSVGEALLALEAALHRARATPAGANVMQRENAEVASTSSAVDLRIEVAALLGRVEAELLVTKLGIGTADSWKLTPLPVVGPPGSFPADAVQLPRPAIPPAPNYPGTSLALPPDSAKAPHKDHYTARELLTLHGAAFVFTAYRAILKREPDAEGLEFFAQSILAGRLSRIDVLASLRKSAEGKAARSRVPGLRGLLLRHRLAAIPVIGYLYLLGQALMRLPHLPGRLDLLEERDRLLEDRGHQLAFSLDQIAGVTEAVLSELRQRQAHLFNVGNHLIERVNLLQSADEERKTNVRGLARHVGRLEESIAAVRTVAEGCAARDELHSVGEAAHAALGALRESFDAAQAEVEESRARALRVQGAIDALRSEVRAFEEQARAHMREVEAHMQDFEADTRGHLEKMQADLESAVAPDPEVARLQGVLAETQPRIEALVQGLNNAGMQIVDVTGGLHGFAAEARGQLRALGEAVNDQQRRLGRLLEELATASGMPTGDARRAVLDTHRSRILDAFYVEFERRFRGERAEIKRRLEVYVPIVRDSAVSKRAPLLDVGCGRGELLEVLRDNAIPARGVDINAIQVKQCEEHGLAAVQGDALEHLRAVKDEALGAVTGMHVVEHLAFTDLVALLDEVFRVLKRGGVAIFETPNPENLIVGACTFWLDPTHLRPLPPETLSFLAAARGFSPVEVLRLHPFPEGDQLPGGEGMAQLNRLLYGARDYAIVARKP